MLTGAARGKAESPELQAGRTRLIAVAASFAGIGIFIALFVVASTMTLAVQQREQEIGLLRAIAATPSQVRRMIAWEATIVALLGAAAGIWPGMQLAHALARGLVEHGIAPADFAVGDARFAAAGVLAGAWRWRCSRCCRRADVRRASRRCAPSPTQVSSRDCWDAGA